MLQEYDKNTVQKNQPEMCVRYCGLTTYYNMYMLYRCSMQKVLTSDTKSLHSQKSLGRRRTQNNAEICDT